MNQKIKVQQRISVEQKYIQLIILTKLWVMLVKGVYINVKMKHM